MTRPTLIPMPQLTEQMEEATIAKWLVEPGELVSIGDELVEIETDKATMAYASDVAGHLEQLVDEGELVTVGVPIARLHDAAVPAVDGASGPPTAERATAPDSPVDVARAFAGAAPAPESRDEPARATPLARRAAAALDVGLGEVHGTGPRGRVTQNDVLRAAGQAPVETARPARAPEPIIAASQTESLERKATAERRELSTIQRTIARRMTEAKATVPHFQVSCDVVVDASLRARADLQELLGSDVKGPSLNDFIVRACALALRDHPLVNASFAGDHFDVHQSIHVGMAVASDAGLLVATITDADRRSILAIASEARRLASAVRSATATPAELTGATFTVSNLGMFGMSSIVPVINPPQAAILGVGAAREELWLRDGEVATRQVVTLTLSGDHRILNGADAARFLNDVKALLQRPLLLLAR